MYRRCGIDGKVGVVFPRRNLANLLLDREFDKDIREGNLVLYAVSTVDEALGVLTGLEPAKLREKISKRLATFQRIPE
jgi:predicted ATP-dependent protease